MLFLPKPPDSIYRISDFVIICKAHLFHAQQKQNKTHQMQCVLSFNCPNKHQLWFAWNNPLIDYIEYENILLSLLVLSQYFNI